MKKIMLLALAALTALSMVPSQADEGFSVSGTILGSGPSSKAVGGVTELGYSCLNAQALDPDAPDEMSNLQGVDGYWIALPEGVDGLTGTLVSTAVDADVWFYDEGCTGMFDDVPGNGHYEMATLGTANETGPIPVGAAFAIVDVAVGAAVSFTFSIA